MIKIGNEILEARFTSWRAELVGLTDHMGREFIWDGNPDVWKGSSPILFPLVGMVPGDKVLINGKEVILRQHGFAPTSEFELVAHDTESCTFRLKPTEETRLAYPFAFNLDVIYSLKGWTLEMRAVVTNASSQMMPFSFGFHPGFCWPLPGASSKDHHWLEFDEEELAETWRPLNGLLDPQTFPNPVRGTRLELSDDLFDKGAIMFGEIASGGLKFKSHDGPGLAIKWRNLPHLGIWTKPGARYLCIEPWHGYPAPQDFAGELTEKPGIVLLEPGKDIDFTMAITVTV